MVQTKSYGLYWRINDEITNTATIFSVEEASICCIDAVLQAGGGTNFSPVAASCGYQDNKL